MKNFQKRIAHVVYSFDSIGGLENGLINLCNNLDPADFFHVIISLTGLGLAQQRIQAGNVKYIALDKQPGNDLTLPFKLARIFRTEKIDTVHLRNWAAMVEGYVAAKLARTSCVIYSEHGRHFEDVWEGRRIVTAIHRYILQHVDIALCVSGAVAEEMKELYRLSRPVKVIINGVDTEKFTKLDRTSCRKRFDLPREGTIVGSVGRLVTGKNYDHLIEDFLASFATGMLVIVGDGPENSRLQQLVKERGGEDRIRLLGHSDKICELLNCFDLFVLPSASEGLSNVLLEAMSCGLPIVVYNVGGNRELIEQGRGGILVPPDNRAEFMRAAARIVGNQELAMKMSRFNRNKVVENLSLARMQDAYGAMYAGCR